ncbi:hypothetical protein NC653_034313 [Populus alba x Populus x berolinensis]|uniref:Protein kinase domain-containing protein n=1 Tax=Populus alba x Populus x berolinensis TaxID=444605 RepID=A0AAD6PXM6_9ROSI|nr:hypothetical protein NC653_034313 [Populus alba x Populus x berolinensis]
MKSANPVKSPLFVNPTPCINGTYSGVLIKSNITYVENLCKVELFAEEKKGATYQATVFHAPQKNIEEFLQHQNSFRPIRYSYSEIKKITNGFKNKLGRGGYGSVYEGKLRSGSLAEVKM